jgi:hypothetical protein
MPGDQPKTIAPSWDIRVIYLSAAIAGRSFQNPECDVRFVGLMQPSKQP